MIYQQNISGTFFSKVRLFLSRGGLLGNEGRLLGNKAGLLEERIKILNDTRDTHDTHDTFLKILIRFLSILSGCEPSNYTQKVALFHIDTTKKGLRLCFCTYFGSTSKWSGKKGEMGTSSLWKTQ